MTKSSVRRILDVRPEKAFLKRHRVGAVNIPLEGLSERIHELPSPNKVLIIYDDNRTRSRWARSRLSARGRRHIETVFGEQWLEAGPVTSGPAKGRLWDPHALLVEAIGHATQVWGGINGRIALDIACGTGRDAVFMALAGFDVEAWDVLPDALQRCEDLARRSGVTLRTLCRDVERCPAFPAGSFDLVSCFNFLHRPLMPTIAKSVRPGGMVVYETFVHPQRALFGKPRRETHVLRPDELLNFFKAWKVDYYREGLTGPRRVAASLIARKPD